MQRFIRGAIRQQSLRPFAATFASSSSSERPPKQSSSSEKDEEDYLANTSRVTKWFAETFEKTRMVSDPDLRRLIAQGFTTLTYGTLATVCYQQVAVILECLKWILYKRFCWVLLAWIQHRYWHRWERPVWRWVWHWKMVSPKRYPDVFSLFNAHSNRETWFESALELQYVRVQLVESTPGQERGGVVSIPSSIVYGNPIVIEPASEAEKSMQKQRVEGVLPDDGKDKASASRVVSETLEPDPQKDRRGEEMTMEKNRQMKEEKDKAAAKKKK
jgi:hypothetical protein